MKKVLVVVALMIILLGYFKYRKSKKAAAVAAAKLEQEKKAAADATAKVEKTDANDEAITEVLNSNTAKQADSETADVVLDKVQLIVEAAIDETALKFEDLEQN